MSTIITHTIHANMAMLEARLAEATDIARDAIIALDASRNQAIGTLLPIERELVLATALYNAIVTLHRTPACLLGEDGGGQ